VERELEEEETCKRGTCDAVHNSARGEILQSRAKQ
jgi:hypothetical protein